ncbi:MAG: FecR domain-containing protein [Bdellovibrionales bacterium]|jgi:hypothetical protein|nr:FecR domain-containing protein [Bdellovibrionales bacterium]
MKLILIILFICTISNVSAEVVVGKVILLRGTVFADDSKIFKGDPIFKNASLKTKEKSIVKILFFDKTTMTIGPNSTVLVKRFPKDGTKFFSLAKGFMRSKVVKDLLSEDSDKPKMVIKTNNTSLGVRGTDFQVTYNEENQITSLITFEGEVSLHKIEEGGDYSYQELSDITMSESSYIVREGQFSINNPEEDNISVPTKLSPLQFNLFKNNENLLEGSAGKKKDFPNEITPPGLPSHLVANKKKVSLDTVISRQVTKSDLQGLNNIVKSFNSNVSRGNNNAYSLPAGGFLDIKTSRYISPPSGSTYDANLNIYNPRSEIGRVNLSTGSYIPPEGTRLNPAGQFEALDNKVSNDHLKRLNTIAETEVNETISSIRGVKLGDETALLDELVVETSRGEEEDSIADNVIDQLSEISNEIESSNSNTSLTFNIVIITDEDKQ